jgi:hypothetical protein
VFTVAARAARQRALVGKQLERARYREHGLAFDLGGDAAGAGQAVQMPQQAKSGHVGDRVCASRLGRGCGRGV